MKKTRVIFLFIFVLFTGVLCSRVNASTIEEFDADKNALMYLEVNGTGRIIKKDTKVSEIQTWYDKGIRYESESLFGGRAYSFYYGDNFEDYLYIETKEDGTIFSYGSTDPSYRTKTYNYGDEYPYNNRTTLGGYLVSGSDGNLIAAVHYNKSAYTGSVSKVMKSFSDAYQQKYCEANDLDSYDEMGSDKDNTFQPRFMLDTSKHAVLMFNSIMMSSYNNSKALLETDKDENGMDTFRQMEDYFYINNQFLPYNGNLYLYVMAKGYGSSMFQTLCTNLDFSLIGSSQSYLFNPLIFGQVAKDYTKRDLKDKTIAVWSYRPDINTLSGTSFSPKILEEHDPVSLTDDEAQKYSEGKAYYDEAKKLLYLGDPDGYNIYKSEPNYDTVKNIYPGELKDNVKDGITAYYNMIRAGAGLSIVKRDDEGFKIAQMWTTVLAYRWDHMHIDIQHAFNEEELSEMMSLGLTEEYYREAIGWGKSWGNSLSRMNLRVGANTMQKHVNNIFQDDASQESDLFDLGHRVHVLAEGYTKFGFGIAGAAAEINLRRSTYGEPTQTYPEHDCSGWPVPNGVTFLDAVLTQSFMWHCQFDVEKYEVQDSTTAEVTCLNTGDKWNFDEEVVEVNHRFQAIPYGRSEMPPSYSNKIVLYDVNISPVHGYVYEVVVKGIKNVETQQIEDYKYRVVFEWADDSRNYFDDENGISIDRENLYKMEGYEAVYQVPTDIDIKLKLNYEDENSMKLLTKWTSSNPEVISVTQDGTIRALKPSDEQVIISARLTDTNSVDQVVLVPYVSLKDVGMTPETVELSKSEGENTQEFRVTTVPDEVTEILSIDWVLSDGTSNYRLTKSPPESEYGGSYVFKKDGGTIDDNLNKYFAIDEINIEDMYQGEGVIRSIVLRVIGVDKSRTQFRLMAYVTALSDMYRKGKQYGGVSNISVSSKIERVDTYLDINGVTELIDNCDTPEAGTPKTTLSLKGEGPYEFPLSTKLYPDDTTEENTNLAFSIVSGNAEILDGNILKVKDVGDVTIKRAGAKEKEFTLHFDAPLTSLVISSDLEKYVEEDGQKIYTKGFTTDMKNIFLELSVTRSPSINKDELEFVFENDVTNATVDDTGVISFTGPGLVKIKARTKTDPSVESNLYQVNAIEDVSNFRLTDSIAEENQQTVNVLNIDYDILKTHDEYVSHSSQAFQSGNQKIETDLVTLNKSPRATYDDMDSDNPSVYKPEIKYSLEGNIKKLYNAIPVVSIDESTGVLTFCGAVNPEDEVKVVAKFKNIEGFESQRSYNLIINKRTTLENVTCTSTEGVELKAEDGKNVYHLDEGKRYNFRLEPDITANDNIYCVKNTAFNEDSSIVTLNFPGDNTFRITTLKNSGGNTIDSGYVIKNSNVKTPLNDIGGEEKVGISYSADYEITDGDIEKEVNFVIDISGYQKGDVNKDRLINSTDSAMVLDLYKSGIVTDEQKRLGDMNNDGILNSDDAGMILDIYAQTSKAEAEAGR